MADGNYSTAQICEHCDKSFTGRKRRYCSRRCQDNASRKRCGIKAGTWTGRRIQRGKNLAKPIAKKRPIANPIVAGKRECFDCNEVKLLSEFRTEQRTDRSYILGRCKACETLRRKYRAQPTNEQRKIYRERSSERSPERKKEIRIRSGLSEANAKQAWQYWIKEKAPNEWVAAYWEAIGEPWRNPRLTSQQKYAMRYRLDCSFVIKERMRRQLKKKERGDDIGECIRSAIRRQGRSNRVEVELGYSIADLIAHLEKQFTKGMTMEKLKDGEIHIDHIVPQAAFDLSADDEWKACWSLANLRPMWARDNMAKSDKVLFLV